MRLYIISALLLSPLTVMGDICATDKNVKDYFLSIPHEIFMIGNDATGPLTTRNDRESAIQILDIENGFIELHNESVWSRIQIALFRAREKRPVLTATRDGASVQNVYAFICVNEEWVDVTATLFPWFTHTEIAQLYNSINALPDKVATYENLEPVVHTLVRYKLPRFGRKIQAYASHPDIDYPEEKLLFGFVPDLGKLSWD